MAKLAYKRDRGTTEVHAYPFKYGDVGGIIWDTPGLQHGWEDDDECLRLMKDKGCNDADIMLYCVDMSDTRFREADRCAINNLTQSLGNKIWNNAIFVMTFANEVVDQFKDKNTGKRHGFDVGDHFNKCLTGWKEALFDATLRTGVGQDVRIPVIPVGFNVHEALPENDNWMENLWNALKRTCKYWQEYIIRFHKPDPYSGSAEVCPGLPSSIPGCPHASPRDC